MMSWSATAVPSSCCVLAVVLLSNTCSYAGVRAATRHADLSKTMTHP
jgi:hypothetical protein